MLNQLLRDDVANHQKIRPFVSLLAFPIALLWMEIVIKLWDFGSFWGRGLLYTTLFTCSIGLLLSLACTLGSHKTNRRVSLLLLGGLSVFYMTQAVYFTVMRTVLAVYSVSVATDATEYWRVGLLGVWRTLPAILFLAVPFALLCVFGKWFTPERLLGKKQVLATIALSVLCYGAAVGSIFISKGGILDPWELYHKQTNPELCLANFGVLTSLRLDMKRLLFPPKEAEEQEPQDMPVGLKPGEDPQETEYEPNVMDIDFAALEAAESDDNLRSLHHYFAQKRPTMKNEYTGLFAGKNLIMITAEAFNSWAIDEERTPTLYRLSQEGFVAKNFYTPLWWVSTSDGEYVTCTSLIPKSGEQSFGASAENSLYFSLGNQLRGIGYQTNAYHNHTYTYYKRDQTHTNMGYDYKGVGNGLDMSPLWPESDQEMMELTVPEYVDNAPFHTYYMTVSGHLQYFFEENDMAAKHRDTVEDLDLSEESKAYLACQVELDRAVENLLTQLEQAGQLENTVICLYGDHYPYGLSKKAIEELGGTDLQGTTDLFRSTMILWSGDMEEPIVIEKPCSNLDILPTLSNLFGLEYDSRLLMGRDILSDDPGLVIFSDYSYITELGEYHAKEDLFTPNPGISVPGWYPETVLQHVQDKFLYSGKILETDYYRALGLVAD